MIRALIKTILASQIKKDSALDSLKAAAEINAILICCKEEYRFLFGESRKFRKDVFSTPRIYKLDANDNTFWTQLNSFSGQVLFTPKAFQMFLEELYKHWLTDTIKDIIE